MGKNVFSKAKSYITEKKRKSRRFKVFAGLAAMVVFCTVYALILPAITLEWEESTVDAVVYEDETCAAPLETDTEITVTGEFTEGTTAAAYPAEVPAELNTVCAYDITVQNTEGELWQPAPDETAKVSITLPELSTYAENRVITVYYVAEDGTTEPVPTKTDGETVTFEAEHFSVYAVTAEQGIPSESDATETEGTIPEDDVSGEEVTEETPTAAPVAAAAATPVNSFDALKKAFNDGVTDIQLSADITLTGTINVTNVQTLDLHGHKLTISNNNSLFNVGNGGNFTVTDSVAPTETVTIENGDNFGREATYKEGKLTYYVTETKVADDKTGATEETLTKHEVSAMGAIVGNGGSGCAFQVNNGGTFNLSGGYICGFNSSSDGGSIRVNNGTLNISDKAVIAANSAPRGGAIYANNAKINISGGVISGNKSTQGHTGGNEDTTSGGGGLYCQNSTVTMSDGYVTNNIADQGNYFDGGGAFLMNGGTFTISDTGKITGNISIGGGAIKGARRSGASIYMQGGFISANHATGAEGGGVNLDNDCKGYLTAGHLTNNVLTAEQHWGGGGIFCSDGAQLYVQNALITENKAGGFGGGVAGCSTGRVTITVSQGGAICNNKADGEHLSGGESAKNEDHIYGANDEIFKKYGYDDYFCALNSSIHGTMLGEHPANWSGSVDGVPVSGVPKDDILEAEFVMGLTAHPDDAAIKAAQEAAKIYINGNDSFTHGGGILANGYLVIGETTEISVGARLELNGSKLLKQQDGQDVDQVAGQFRFEIKNEAGAVVAKGTNDETGKITFDQRLPFNKELVDPDGAMKVDNEVRTFTYYLNEVPNPDSDSNDIQIDTSHYRIIVNVKKVSVKPDLEGINGPIKRYRYDISSVIIDKQNGDGNWVNVYTNNNPGVHESNALTVTIPTPTFVNYKVDETNLTVKKVWVDGGTPPESITVHLLQNGNVHYTVILNESNQWQYTWENLPLKDDNGNIYQYTVREDPVEGYSPEYTFTTAGSSDYYWVPATSIEVGHYYMIVNPVGDYALSVTDAHRNDGFSADDRKAVTKKTGNLELGGKEYSEWYDAGIDYRMMFVAQQTDTQDNPRIVFKNCGTSENSWLLVQNKNSNDLKGCENIPYASAIKYENNLIKGQFEWKINNTWRTVIYTNNKFTTDTNTDSAARLFTRVSGPVSHDTTVTITNTPVKEIRYSLDITKTSAEDNNLMLNGATFQLLKDGEPLFFTGGNGIYVYHGETEGDGAVTDMVTANRGKLVISNLPAGNYTLRETKAPAGYLTVPDKEVTLGDTENTTIQYTIEDPKTTYTLPETGGGGTVPFVVGGLLLMAAALSLLYLKRCGRERRVDD